MFPIVSETVTMPKLMFPFHDHPLSCIEENAPLCDLCVRNKEEGVNRILYHCRDCPLRMHKDCVEEFLNCPFPCSHFLKIIMPKDCIEERSCHFCRSNLQLSAFACCTICNINVDLSCVRYPPRHTIFQPKHHKHSFTLLSRLVTFTCNACGVEGDCNPYICLECNMMIHKDCIDRPWVISINRHDHRIAHTFHLGQGEENLKCGVCRKTIDWVYGAFKCSRCPSYVIHSKCATRKEVWDGRELENMPEEEEIEDPFKVINEKDIIHFSHEKHVMRLDESYVTANDNIRCGGCILAINDDPCYRCVECDFSLHKRCASFPRKKRHLLHNHRLTLRVDKDDISIFQCRACRIYSNGFRYECNHINHELYHDDIKFDIRCSSVSEPFLHDLHPHPLYWTLESSKRCHACHIDIYDFPLSCTDCEYHLCMKCATLPRKVKHRCDDHFLSLSQGVKSTSGDLWCDICETKTYPSVCYYTCDECGLSLHISCVLGDIYYTKVGHTDPTFPDDQILANNGVTRPLCIICETRRKFPFLVRGIQEGSISYICSIHCGRGK